MVWAVKRVFSTIFLTPKEIRNSANIALAEKIAKNQTEDIPNINKMRKDNTEEGQFQEIAHISIHIRQ
jgi:hypothetical protein